MSKLSWENHEYHIELLEEYYAFNKYYWNEPLKDAILDAIECLRYASELKENEEPETIGSTGTVESYYKELLNGNYN